MSALPHLIGQPFARRILSSALAEGRVASAYLFEGPPGVGKKTAAVDFASAWIGGEGTFERATRGGHPDVRLFAPGGASFKVDQVEAILEETALRPFEGSRRAFVVDRAEDLTLGASNRLLKALEEPPAGLVWILVTTQRARIPATIASRCQSVRFHPLDDASLRRVLEAALAVDAREARDLAVLSGGSVRVAAWLREPDGRACLAEAEAFLEAAGAGTLVERLDWVEGALGNRKGLERLLSVLWVLLRERWVAARGLPEDLRLLSAPPVHGGGLSPAALESMMDAARGCLEALEKNANAPLALTALALAGSRG